MMHYTAQKVTINDIYGRVCGMKTAHMLAFTTKTIRLCAPNDSRKREDIIRWCGKYALVAHGLLYGSLNT